LALIDKFKKTHSDELVEQNWIKDSLNDIFGCVDRAVMAARERCSISECIVKLKAVISTNKLSNPAQILIALWTVESAAPSVDSLAALKI
jgi:hypothetical protein